MRLYRFLPLLVLPSLTVFFSGALSLQSPVVADPTAPEPIFPVRADPAAVAVLDRAIAALSSEAQPWVKTQLWQQVSVPPVNFQAEGTYLGGPAHRLRLNLQVRRDRSTSQFQLISDGRILWQVEEVAGTKPRVSKVQLSAVLEAMKAPESAAARSEFYDTQFFLGVAPLLRSLRQQVTFSRRDAVRWSKHDVELLTGAWAAPPADRAWPAFFPRQCRVFVDRHSNWVHRVEWWGPTTRRPGDSLIFQMEFRNPVCGQPLAESEFAYDPGKASVVDLTPRWTESLQAQ
ncbi:MAG: hypothetical protein K2R98_07915 [Gemmataceae bacterium]|nr:hypothetical protein [Gemmataceae bacterium]